MSARTERSEDRPRAMPCPRHIAGDAAAPSLNASAANCASRRPLRSSPISPIGRRHRALRRLPSASSSRRRPTPSASRPRYRRRSTSARSPRPRARTRCRAPARAWTSRTSRLQNSRLSSTPATRKNTYIAPLGAASLDAGQCRAAARRAGRARDGTRRACERSSLRRRGSRRRPARCTNAGEHEVLYSISLPRSGISAGGATIQPSRQPVISHALEKAVGADDAIVGVARCRGTMARRLRGAVVVQALVDIVGDDPDAVPAAVLEDRRAGCRRRSSSRSDCSAS